MITVKQFLDAGFELSIGDILNTGEFKSQFNKADKAYIDDHAEEYGDYIIEECAFRTNTGSQPVPDNCPVIYMTSAAVEHPSKAGDLNWNLRLPLAAITNWKPDLEALEKMLVNKPTMKRLSLEQERAMYDSFGRIAKACGKSFIIDIGYEQLPDLVESMIDESLTPQTDREKMLVMALLRFMRRQPLQTRRIDSGELWVDVKSLSVPVFVDMEFRIPPSKLDLLSEQVEQTLGKEAAEIVKEAVDKCPMMKEVFGG